MTCRMASPSARAASSARASSSTLRALPTDFGGDVHLVRAAALPARRRATVRWPAGAAAGRRRRGLGGRGSPASERSAVWAKPVVSPGHDPDAGAALAARA